MVAVAVVSAFSVLKAKKYLHYISRLETKNIYTILKRKRELFTMVKFKITDNRTGKEITNRIFSSREELDNFIESDSPFWRAVSDSKDFNISIEDYQYQNIV